MSSPITPTPPTPTASGPSTDLRPRSITNRGVRFSVRQYLKMDRAGLFDDGKVELVFGRIYKMHAQANPHRWCISKGNRVLPSRFPPDKFWLVGQGTLVLDRHAAPEPDFHLFDVPEGTPDDKLPVPLLIIEVSDTTYRRDSGPKLRQYAKAGVPDYWIVNINAHRVEVYRSPAKSATTPNRWTYAETQAYSATQSIALLRVPGVSIAASDLLP